MTKPPESRGRKLDSRGEQILKGLQRLEINQVLPLRLTNDEERQTAYYLARSVGIKIKVRRPKGQLEVERVE